MTDQTSNPPKARTPLWLRITLVASLALNLAVAGVIAGAVMMRDSDRRPGAGVPRDITMPYSRAVAPEDRRSLMRALRSEMASNRPARDAVRAEYEQALVLLRADPFDPEALAAHLAAQAERSQSRLKAGQRVLLSYLADLDAADRAAYADRLEAAMERGFKPKGREGGPPKPRD